MPIAPPVTVIMTVKNDASACLTTLASLRGQTRLPDQVIVVDGGSTDGTLAGLRAYARDWPSLEVIEAPGANIAAGRNIATRAARHEIIACIDAGCRAADNWLDKLTAPFEDDPSTDFVAGAYRVEPQSLFEEVVGLATMRGQLDPIDPKTFNPSARSLAYRRSVWRQAGGWPEWIRFSEDTLFDHRVRQLAIGWRFAGDAVVHWRPRTTWRGLARQFFNYGTGRGQTQLGRLDFLYNLRNIVLGITLVAASFWSRWVLPMLVVHLLYFYVCAFHPKALRIAKHTGRVAAYPLSIGIHWVVLISHLAGFLAGTWQRQRDKTRYCDQMSTYLAGSNI